MERAMIGGFWNLPEREGCGFQGRVSPFSDEGRTEGIVRIKRFSEPPSYPVQYAQEFFRADPSLKVRSHQLAGAPAGRHAGVLRQKQRRQERLMHISGHNTPIIEGLTVGVPRTGSCNIRPIA